MTAATNVSERVCCTEGCLDICAHVLLPSAFVGCHPDFRYFVSPTASGVPTADVILHASCMRIRVTSQN